MGLLDGAKSVVEYIFNAILDVWDWIKNKVHDLIVSFRKIVNHFRELYRKRQLQKQLKTLAVVIKKNLDNGNVNVVSCLFSKETEQIEEITETQVFDSARDLDEETRRAFGDKDMIILQ